MITDASEYGYVTIPAGVTIDGSHFSLPMPVRDATSDAVMDRAFRGVDPAFLLEAIGERTVASWQSSTPFANYTFPRGVTANPFATVINWMLYGTDGGIGASKRWRHKPQQAVRIAASSGATLASVYGGVLSAADITADAADFAAGEPPRRASVLKIYNDLYSYRHFVTQWNSAVAATKTMQSSSYSVTGSYVGDEDANTRNQYNSDRAKYSSGGSAIGTSAAYYHSASWIDWTGTVFESKGKYGREVTAELTAGSYQVVLPSTVHLSLWGPTQAYAFVLTSVDSTSYYDWVPTAHTLDTAQRKLTFAASALAGAAAAVRSGRGIVAKGTGSFGTSGSQTITQSVLGYDFAVDLTEHTDWKKYIQDNFGGI